MASWIVDLFGHVFEIKINAPRNYQKVFSENGCVGWQWELQL